MYHIVKLQESVWSMATQVWWNQSNWSIYVNKSKSFRFERQSGVTVSWHRELKYLDIIWIIRLPPVERNLVKPFLFEPSKGFGSLNCLVVCDCPSRVMPIELQRDLEHMQYDKHDSTYFTPENSPGRGYWENQLSLWTAYGPLQGMWLVR